MTRKEFDLAISYRSRLYHIIIDPDEGQRTVKARCTHLRLDRVTAKGPHALYRPRGSDIPRVIGYADIYTSMRPIIDEAHKRGKR